MPDELFDVVDENDVVKGQEMRSIVHNSGLWHRGVHVLLFTQDNKILVQQRSRDRIHAPLALDCSVSEHVKAGENYDVAATRGLKEELGITRSELQALIKFKMNYGPNDNEISKLYKGFVDPVIVKFDHIEIEQINYYTLGELKELIERNAVIFSYWFEQILRWHMGNPSALQVLETYTNLSTK